ncbi:sulfotransferase family 2 domain-containing protein [Pseudomonas iridis]|uniref:sulfotransferase family protein n=1 Tax=Pseudomonas TaxID=286 RepID=UPI001B343C91|nr:sulfotransferase family protein [Pseudomonas sp. P42]MBP5950316.1 sulfotransferase family 2 domain-containing protein [Pseudomonas sp. P42]
MTSTDDQLLPDFLTWNSCVSQERKLFYVATPKVACTSLKWWFAELEGVAEAVRQLKTSSETDPELVIHDSLNIVAPQLSLHSQEQLQEIKTGGFFSFALVRNPYKRLFSAWQSKILLREPLQIEAYLDQAFVTCPVKTMLDVAAAFECFLEYLNTYEAGDFQDWHWAPQYELLKPQLFPYSAVSKIEDTGGLNEALRAHLGDAYVNPFTSSKANESLIPYLPEFISPRSKALIELLYADDFEFFDYSTELPPAKEQFSQENLTLALKGIELLRGRHLRIAEMRQHCSAEFSALLKDKDWLVGQRDTWMAVCKEKETELVELQGYCAGEAQRLEMTHAELERLKVEIAQTNVALAHSNNELQHANQELAKSVVESKQIEAELAKSVVENRQIEAELAKSVVENRQIEAELAKSVVENRQIEAELAKSVVENRQIEAELAKRNAEAAILQTELAEIKSDVSRLMFELEQANADCVQSKYELAQTNSMLAQSNSDLAQSNSELARLKSDLARSTIELAQSGSELAQSNSELVNSNSELARSNSELAQSNAQLDWSKNELIRLQQTISSMIFEQEAFALRHKRYLSFHRFVESGLVNRLRKAGRLLKGRKGE